MKPRSANWRPLWSTSQLLGLRGRSPTGAANPAQATSASQIASVTRTSTCDLRDEFILDSERSRSVEDAAVGRLVARDALGEVRHEGAHAVRAELGLDAVHRGRDVGPARGQAAAADEDARAELLRDVAGAERAAIARDLVEERAPHEQQPGEHDPDPAAHGVGLASGGKDRIRSPSFSFSSRHVVVCISPSRTATRSRSGTSTTNCPALPLISNASIPGRSTWNWPSAGGAVIQNSAPYVPLFSAGPTVRVKSTQPAGRMRRPFHTPSRR